MSNINKDTKYILPIILFTIFIDLLGFSIVIPILAPLLALPYGSPILQSTDYQTRAILFGFLIASYPLAQFFFTPILGQLSDRYGRKPLLLLSLIGTLIGRILFIIGILSSNIVLLFISRIMDGVTGGNISVAQSAIADITTKENKARNFGLIGAAFGVGFIIGPYLGGQLSEFSVVNWFAQFLPSWIANASTLPLWFATILCFINILTVIFIFKETIKETVHKKIELSSSVNNIVKAFQIPNLRAIFIIVFLLFVGFNFFTQFLSVYIGTKFGEEIRQDVNTRIANGQLEIQYPSQFQGMPETAPIKMQFKQKYTESMYQAETQKRTSDMFSYIGIWVVIAQAMVAPILAKRFKSSVLLKAGLLLSIPAIISLIFPDKLLWLYFMLPFIAIANGLTQPNATAIVSNSADAKSQGEVLGINTSVQALAQAIPPIINGFILTIAIQLPIIVAAGMSLLALIAMFMLYKENSKAEFHEE